MVSLSRRENYKAFVLMEPFIVFCFESIYQNITLIMKSLKVYIIINYRMSQ